MFERKEDESDFERKRKEEKKEGGGIDWKSNWKSIGLQPVSRKVSRRKWRLSDETDAPKESSRSQFRNGRRSIEFN